MKHILLLLGAMALLCIGWLLTPTLVTAQGALYELSQSWFGSGGTVSGGAYAMTLSVGDPGAGAVRGGVYSLGGGILGGGARVVAPSTPTPTATLTPEETPIVISPKATATTAPTGSTGPAVKLFLPLVGR